MNFENIFILPNVIGDRSRRRFGGIFIKIPKVTSARPSSMVTHGCMEGMVECGDVLRHLGMSLIRVDAFPSYWITLEALLCRCDGLSCPNICSKSTNYSINLVSNKRLLILSAKIIFSSHKFIQSN